MGAFFVVMLLILTAAILVTGLVGFMRGGEFNKKYGNKLMRARIGMQFFAVIVIVLVAWISGN